MRLLPGVLVLAAAWPAVPRESTAPPVAFRYTPAQLDCATFLQHSGGQLDAEIGARRRRETLRRDGVLRFRARSAGGAIAVEAWYDSLALSRRSPEAVLVPDTDGLLGGRYRGTLSPAGRYAPGSRPFVPDEVAEVADLGGALDDLLPPLPPVPLAVGQGWNDGGRLELRRLPDSSAAGRVVHRLALRARATSDRAVIRGDTTRLAARQVTVEHGQVDWDPVEGLLRRVRHVVVETSVPAGGPLKLPLRSRLEQDDSLFRGERHCEVGSP